MAALRERLSEAEIERLATEGATWSDDWAADEARKAVKAHPTTANARPEFGSNEAAPPAAVVP